LYVVDVRSIVGGYWSNGASCGSRYLNNNTVGTLNSNYGARAASDMWAGIYIRRQANPQLDIQAMPEGQNTKRGYGGS